MKIIKQFQFDCFSQEINILSERTHLPKNIFRVRSRLEYSYVYQNKYPIILDSDHMLTKLLFLEVHQILLHTGSQLLLNDIRKTYCFIKGCSRMENLYKTAINNPKPLQALTGNYP